MTDHQAEQLLYRIKKMREAQKAYYGNTSRSNLITAKQWEWEVDKWIKVIEDAKAPHVDLFTSGE